MKTKNKALCLLFSLLMFMSCSDFLDQVPDEKLSEDILFDSKDDVVRVLTQIYYNQSNPLEFRGELNDVPGTSGDDIDYNWNNYSPYKKDVGQYSASSPIYNQWQRYYQSIRLSIYFLENIDKCHDEKLSDEEKLWWIGEAYFLQAYYYFMLLNMYGPVPIIDKVYSPEEATGVAENGIPRSSFDDCVKHIDQLLEKASMLLDTFYNSSSTERAGRASKAAAKFLQARLWLYAASPLYNGMQNPVTKKDYSNLNPKGIDGQGLINTTYDASKWEKAVKVAEEAIQICNAAGRALYKDGNGYTSCWKLMNYSRGGDPVVENIFYRQNYSTGDIRTHALPISWSGYSGICPTLEHVNEYFMANGLLPEDDPDYKKLRINDMETYESEDNTFTIPMKYTKRDPRFYVNILFPGQYSYAVLGDEEVSTSTRWAYNTNKDFKDEIFYRPYYNGQDGYLKKTGRNYTINGFLNIKFVGKTDSKTAKGDCAISFFRLAELYLNYSEAMFEHTLAQGGNPLNNEAVFTYWDMIRHRAGIPTVRDAYKKAGITLTVDKLRQLIRREREIELAFEGHRYFDNRRWLIAEREGGDKHGMNILKDENDGFWDESYAFETRYWDNKMYFLPINQTEIDKNKLLTQNVGW
ncbi:MAG: RagB/SusD family nutrient uptake outer membrane protein [Tannerellaceae bacterium]|jgi:hypothetical protein|nr:RagB/SusD family nutrient uptake outer membrane protein [Tannerellaceae bacterium]